MFLGSYLVRGVVLAKEPHPSTGGVEVMRVGLCVHIEMAQSGRTRGTHVRENVRVWWDVLFTHLPSLDLARHFFDSSMNFPLPLPSLIIFFELHLLLELLIQQFFREFFEDFLSLRI